MSPLHLLALWNMGQHLLVSPSPVSYNWKVCTSQNCSWAIGFHWTEDQQFTPLDKSKQSKESQRRLKICNWNLNVHLGSWMLGNKKEGLLGWITSSYIDPHFQFFSSCKLEGRQTFGSQNNWQHQTTGTSIQRPWPAWRVQCSIAPQWQPLLGAAPAGRKGWSPPARRCPCILSSGWQMGCLPCCDECMAVLSSLPNPSDHK